MPAKNTYPFSKFDALRGSNDVTLSGRLIIRHDCARVNYRDEQDREEDETRLVFVIGDDPGLPHGHN